MSPVIDAGVIQKLRLWDQRVFKLKCIQRQTEMFCRDTSRSSSALRTLYFFHYYTEHIKTDQSLLQLFLNLLLNALLQNVHASLSTIVINPYQ